MTPRELLAQQFRTFTRSAWRLETRDSYTVPAEQASLTTFLATGELNLTYSQPWFDSVRAAKAAGQSYERVRVYPEPLTDYLKFEFAVAPFNIDAGEDIRVMPRSTATTLGLPGYDYWLFDDERVIVMHFDDTVGLAAVEVLNDPDTVSQHRAWRDIAWAHADKFETYSMSP